MPERAKQEAEKPNTVGPDTGTRGTTTSRVAATADAEAERIERGRDMKGQREEAAGPDTPQSAETQARGETKAALRQTHAATAATMTHEQRARIVDDLADPSVPEADALPPPSMPFERRHPGQRYANDPTTQEGFGGDPDNALDHFKLQRGHHLRDAEVGDMNLDRERKRAEAAQRIAEAATESARADAERAAEDRRRNASDKADRADAKRRGAA